MSLPTGGKAQDSVSLLFFQQKYDLIFIIYFVTTTLLHFLFLAEFPAFNCLPTTCKPGSKGAETRNKPFLQSLCDIYSM